MTDEIFRKADKYGKEFAERILNESERERRETAIRVAHRLREISGGSLTIQQIREALAPEGFQYKSDSAYQMAAKRIL